MKCIIEPAINVYSKEEYQRRIASVKNEAEMVQFDVIDGIFAQPRNYNNLNIVKREIIPEKLDLHLMVSDIKSELKHWIPLKPARIILHLENPILMTDDLRELEKQGIKRGLAIAPLTSLDEINQMIKMIDYLLVMSVMPGRNGQKFFSNTFDRIKAVRSKFPQLHLGVDGGVGEDHLRILKEIGVSNIVVGSALFQEGSGSLKRFTDIIR